MFDQFTLRVIEKLRGQGHFDELKSSVALGKEANIFTAKADPDVIVKIYRLETRDFTGMLDYLVQDPRYLHIKKRKREIVFAWTQREYANLMKAREVIPVPKVIAAHKNVLVMEMIEDNGKPAPQLKDKEPENPEKFFETVIDYMKRLRKLGMIHGDLSEFNILNWKDEPLFIDFSQASPLEASMAQEMWDRDVKNIIRAAKRCGLTLTEDQFE